MNRPFAILLSLIASCAAAAGLEPITLNPPDTSRGLPVMQALQHRVSSRAFSDRKLSHQDLSDLLWAANGVNRPDKAMRTAPSAMNAQDVDVYVFLEEGAYLYDALKSALSPVAPGDHRNLLAGRQGFVATAPAVLLMVSDISRFKHGDQALKMSWAAMDAGIVSQNIALFCAGAGLATVPRAIMDTDKLRELLKLTESQQPLLNNPVGYPK